MRTIMSAQVNQQDDGVACLTIRGSSFLWHQIRCIVAVLVRVGSGVESPDVVARLLDVAVNHTVEGYNMAEDYPLMLWDCEYEPPLDFRIDVGQ